ncbi:hypothetical protein QAD02_007287 [Eretmocerus hayati]|uniref:Uncharacterized protein n=1 Tax=Eretmocerus hayati TaxID=131215 RepID=A0ACC2N7K2_9HYME|nr:hypothetical protein QAD02_007287 [Eretmocerus hayati]
MSVVNTVGSVNTDKPSLEISAVCNTPPFHFKQLLVQNLAINVPPVLFTLHLATGRPLDDLSLQCCFTDDVETQYKVNERLIGSFTGRTLSSPDITPETPSRCGQPYGSYDIYDFNHYADHEPPQAVFHQDYYYGDYCDPSISSRNNGPLITPSSNLRDTSLLSQSYHDDCAILNSFQNDGSRLGPSNNLIEIGSLESQEFQHRPISSRFNSDAPNDDESDHSEENSYREEDELSESDAGAESSNYDSSDSDSVSLPPSISQSSILQSPDNRSTDSVDTPTKVLTRKRKRAPEEWVRNKSRQAVISGHGGVSQTGCPIPEREMGPGCHPRCRNKCRSKVSYSDRKKLNCEMRGLSKREDQWKYLHELIQLHDNPNAKVKKIGVTYFLVSNGKKIKVCQTMFNDTFGNYNFNAIFTTDFISSSSS